MKPDLSNVKELSPAQIRELRKRKQEHRGIKVKKRKRGSVPRLLRVPKGRHVVVTSVSILPELKYRAARELGGGNFSAAVTVALTKCLYDLDKRRGGGPGQGD